MPYESFTDEITVKRIVGNQGDTKRKLYTPDKGTYGIDKNLGFRFVEGNTYEIKYRSIETQYGQFKIIVDCTNTLDEAPKQTNGDQEPYPKPDFKNMIKAFPSTEAQITAKTAPAKINDTYGKTYGEVAEKMQVHRDGRDDVKGRAINRAVCVKLTSQTVCVMLGIMDSDDRPDLWLERYRLQFDALLPFHLSRLEEKSEEGIEEDSLPPF